MSSLMANVRKKSNDRDEDVGIPLAPQTCGCPGCKEDCDFLMVKVSSGKGIEHRVASDVLDITHHNGKTFISANGNYQFINWFSRCNECLTQGMQRKKAKLRAEGEHKFYV